MPQAPRRRRSLKKAAGIGHGPAEQRASNFFVDRVDQSQAFSESVLALHRRLGDAEPDVGHRDNVLVFYGLGGIGKTSLSRRLQRWITGRLETPDWGAPPNLGDRVVVTARWDLTDSNGSLVPITLLRDLRKALHAAKPSWPGFDLAFSVFHQKVENTEQVSYGSGLNATAILESALSDLGGAMDLFGAAGIATASTSLLGALVRRTRTKVRTNAAIARHEDYVELLSACEHDAGPAHQPLDLIEALSFTLTEEIDAMPPEKRPLLIVFVDPFEKIQGRGAGSGEDLVSILAKALPLCLFVVAGRDRLTWHERESAQLSAYHPTAWKCLAATVAHEPRQHHVGFLSDKDATDIFTHFQKSEGLPFTPDLIREMVDSAKGLPVHIDALATAAREKVSEGATELTLDDLGHNLPDVLNRLLDDLPVPQAHAFRAACLTSSFDSDLVARVADVDEADVLRLCRRAIVEEVQGAAAPYRIHDALRDIMCRPGADATYSWTENDWKRAAGRAVGVVLDRFDVAHRESGADTPVEIATMIHSLAFAINLCMRWAVYDDRIRSAFKRGPALDQIYPLLDSPPYSFPNPDVADMYDYVRARADVAIDEAELILTRLFHSDSPFSPDAGLWLAYRIRLQGRIDEALNIFSELRERGAGPQAVYRNQYVITLIIDRRFVDALSGRIGDLDDNQRNGVAAQIRRACGSIDESGLDLIERRIERAPSNRFRIELTAERATIAARLGGLSREQAEGVVRAAKLGGSPSHIASALTALGLTYRLSEPVDEILAERDYWAEKGRLRTGRVPRAGVEEILALRMLARGDDADAETILRRTPRGRHRGRSWIPVEIYMEELGHPLPPVDAQWPIPYQEVRENWLGIGRAMAARMSN
ncbi:hypothetical protein AB0P16_11875 [Dietzia maris]|uniref:hypothetical protein n=1 Tax=Dietzia maris TaxID=37915 RepID=UPI003422BF1B